MRFLAVLLLACGSEPYARLYHTEPLAPGYTEEEVAALDHLGATLVGLGVNFGVYSERATRVDLALFDDPESDRPTREFQMSRFGDVWNLYVEGLGVGQFYGYVAWGPNWPYHADWYPGSIAGFLADVDADGNRFNPNKLLHDPYARALHRDHDWSRGSAASGPKRTESTFAAAAKGVVVGGEYEWSAEEAEYRACREDPDCVGHRWNDAIVYEVHLRGLTAETASGVEHPGTYRGAGEMAGYLADLGVTAVEFMPVHEKPLDGGYWGYWTENFFAPEITYSSTRDPLRVLDEFKEMVDALHRRGVEVWLDVVYNHTGEGGLWRERRYIDDFSLDPTTDAAKIEFKAKEIATIYSFRGLDNAAYYALSDDNQVFWNNTGVGNQTRPNHVPARRLILDSVRFYVEELHVDGFRFDLAGILGEVDGDYNTWDDPANTVLMGIVDDATLRRWNTRVVAEPWTLGPYGWLVGAYPAATGAPGVGWYEWNGPYRIWWRSFVNQDDYALNAVEGVDGGGALTGSYDLYAWNGRRPYHSVNYVTSHDGFPMYDLTSFAKRQNGCGPLNPVCCDDPASPWCETDSGEQDNRSRDWGQENEPFKRQLMRNWLVALAISHGTPMLLGGDEWMRTQFGNNNAYSTGADNEWNWFRWGEWRASDEHNRMHDFVRSLLRFRKDHAYAFAPDDWGAGAPFRWKSEANTEPPDWTSRVLMIHYDDPSAGGPELAILINMERDWVSFTLPPGRTWRRVIDTQAYFEDKGADARRSGNVWPGDAEAVPTPEYAVPGSTIVVLEAAK